MSEQPLKHEHKPFVPHGMKMTEFTWRALLLGLALTVILGAANAYLGLRAGITIAATYPAAVIAMAVLRVWKGSILEENIARTAGSIGESVAAGAIFTIPAFLIVRSWSSFDTPEAYWKSTALMLVGGVLGVLFVSLVRRVMVEDPELPFPESVAAAEIHKAGQQGAEAAKHLFWNMGTGAVVYLMGVMQFFAPDKDFLIRIGEIGKSMVRVGKPGSTNLLKVGGVSTVAGPSVSPAYIGVGYIIGPELAALNFTGGLFAWCVMVPLLMYFLGPELQAKFMPANTADADWATMAENVWRSIVRPIAIGGMMVGAANTLFKMRKNLVAGIMRAVAEVRGGGPDLEKLDRTERYMSSKAVFGLIGLAFIAMVALYSVLAGELWIAVVAGVVMLIIGFFFATVSGSLVGMIGSSNNPVSGLTLSTLVIAALLMVSLGVSGPGGVAVVLGVAAVVCVSSAVAGELLQDFKVGYILGGTPRTIQIVELVAVVVASLVMYFPLLVLHQGDINSGGTGFGSKALPAPQAGLMAALAQGIVGGDMPWPLIMLGVFFGIGLILMGVRSPMLIASGMYLQFPTTFSIFVGGLIRWAMDHMSERAKHNQAQKARAENVGVLAASGMIAGEAMVGLLVATLRFFDISLPKVFGDPSYLIGLATMGVLGAILIRLPMMNAGRPEDPAPPTAMM